MSLQTPLDLDPLPVYRRDPEAISIISSAPSYVSEAPTYHSSNPPPAPDAEPSPPAYTPRESLVPPPASFAAANHGSRSSNGAQAGQTLSQQAEPPRPGLLSAQHYAPGYESRARPMSNLDVHAYNVGAWSSISASHASRQLHAVARRRASQSISSTAALLAALTMAPPPLPRPSTPTASSSSMPMSTSSLLPLLPQEDPDLVGEMAAARARNARLYRERCLRGEQRFRHEGKSWDFMLAHMADWDERERSWRGFRDQVSRRRLFGRRLGLRG